MNGPLKTCLLKSGQRIFYGSYETIEETHTQPGLKKHKLYQFSRPGVGIVAVIPEERIQELEWHAD